MAISVNHRRLTFTWATSGTQNVTATCDEREDGWLKCLYWQMPSMSANTSGSLTIRDSGARQLASIAATAMSAAGTSAVTGLEIPIESKSTFEIALTGIPGSAAGVSATPLTGYIDLYMVP